MVFAVRANQFFGRNFDAQIDHIVAVVLENDLDQILADIVHVAFDRGEHHFGALFGVGLLHELFEVANRRFHRFGGLQDLRDNQLIVVEKPAHFAHPRHQRPVDDVKRRNVFGEFGI